MKNWFLKLRMRLKLLLAFGSILVMSVLLTAVGITTIRKIISYNKLSERIQSINVSTLDMSRYIQEFADRGYKQKEFLVDGNSRWLTEYKAERSALFAQLDTLKTHTFFSNAASQNQYAQLLQALMQYDDHVQALIKLYEERGFKDYGVEGQLRAAIHDVEDADFPFNEATMLTLRRHEKDFFLRKDLKYLERFISTINVFQNQIDTVSGASLTREKILANISNYKSEFNHIVDLEQRIGLDIHSGKLGEINNTFNEIDQLLKALTTEITTKNKRVVERSMLLLPGLLVFQIIIGFVLVVFYANLLTKAIKEIKSALVSLSKGSFPNQLIIRTKDEVSEAKHALNQLVDRIKAAVKFSTDLGKGNLKIDYDERFNDDVLSTAIIAMKDQLVAADEKQTAINWSNQGMAKFSEILKNESDNIYVLGDDIIRQLVQYLEANQGALYLIDQSGNQLERIATYAYAKKKFVDHIVQLGQGLVGQCVLEKGHIHVTDVPQGFVKITSGLGESTASNILVVPLIIRDEVMGVLELASFEVFTKLKIDFVVKVSESIANILSNKKSAESTSRLLIEAQDKAEMLKAQEEELRQNSEELQATQEEMERLRKEMENYISQLEVTVESKNNENKKLIALLEENDVSKELLKEFVPN